MVSRCCLRSQIRLVPSPYSAQDPRIEYASVCIHIYIYTCTYVYIYQRDDPRHRDPTIEYTVIALSFAIHLNDRLDRFDILQRDQKPRLYALSFFPSPRSFALLQRRNPFHPKNLRRIESFSFLPSNLRTISSPSRLIRNVEPGSGGTQSPNLSTPGHPPS